MTLRSSNTMYVTPTSVAFRTIRILRRGITNSSIIVVLGPWALGPGQSSVQGPWSTIAACRRTKDHGPRTDQGPGTEDWGPARASSIDLAQHDVNRSDERDDVGDE